MHGSNIDRNYLIHSGSNATKLQRLDASLGFKPRMTVNDYDQLTRRGVGVALRNRLPDATWLRPPTVTDGDDQSEFSKAWKLLCEKFPVWRTLQNTDKLLAIAQYAGIFFNLKMKKEETLDQAVSWGSFNIGDLVGISAYCEHGITNKPGLVIQQDGGDLSDERFNKPTFYSLTTATQNNSKQTLSRIHWSRILLVSDSIFGDYLGRPRVEASSRTLHSIHKLHVLPEGIRRNMMKYVAQAKDGFRITSESKKEFEKQIDEMRYDLRDWLKIQGFDVSTLAGEVPDPTGTWEMLRDWIAAESGVPAQILFGTRPNQAQGSGERQFANIIAARQIAYAEPLLLKPFIKRLIRYGILPQPNDSLMIGRVDANGLRHWPPMHAQSEEQSASVMTAISQAIKARVESGMSLEAALISIGLSEELISEIVKKSKTDEPIAKTKITKQSNVPNDNEVNNE